MGLDMGLVATKKREYLDDYDYDDRFEYDEIAFNNNFYDENGNFQWPDVCEVWYARKFWDMVNSVPVLGEAIDGDYVRISKKDLANMIDFYCYHADYFDGFSGLPRLCELYKNYDDMIAQGVKLFFWMSY